MNLFEIDEPGRCKPHDGPLDISDAQDKKITSTPSIGVGRRNAIFHRSKERPINKSLSGRPSRIKTFAVGRTRFVPEEREYSTNPVVDTGKKKHSRSGRSPEALPRSFFFHLLLFFPLRITMTTVFFW